MPIPTPTASPSKTQTSSSSPISLSTTNSATGSGLSSAAIGGIVGGVVGCTALLAVAAVIKFLVRRNQQGKRDAIESEGIGQIGEKIPTVQAPPREPRLGGRLNDLPSGRLNDPVGGRLGAVHAWTNGETGCFRSVKFLLVLSMS